MKDLPLKDKIEIAAEQIEQSDEAGCLTAQQLRHILADFADSLVKNIAYEPLLATGLTNEQILDEAARREANIALQYEDYSLETWTVASKLLPHRKAYLLDDSSIRKFRIEYEI